MLKLLLAGLVVVAGAAQAGDAKNEGNPHAAHARALAEKAGQFPGDAKDLPIKRDAEIPMGEVVLDPVGDTFRDNYGKGVKDGPGCGQVGVLC